jgi:acetylornithine deacetylase/succinyl-diaminopimelate desuccinylase-like protein
LVPEADAGARAVELLEQLVAIPSVTGSEASLIDFLEKRFERNWTIRSIPVSAGRRNLLIERQSPRVVLTTHADTVPEYFSPRRQGTLLHARGACDAKASLAAMAVALEELDEDAVGLLVLVGEERGSDGAIAADRAAPPGVDFLIGGEPTGNRFVAGSKGCLRIEAEARGVASHSSLAASGTSAIDRLLDFLAALRKETFPNHSVFGATTTNIGVLRGGSAPNVTADSAHAEILLRTGEPVEKLLVRIGELAKSLVEIRVAYRSDPIFFRVPRGVRGEIVAFASDLPLLSSWGEPLLIGPGAIESAHRADEFVDLGEVREAIKIYSDLVRGLLARGRDSLEPRSHVESKVR